MIYLAYDAYATACRWLCWQAQIKPDRHVQKVKIASRTYRPLEDCDVVCSFLNFISCNLPQIHNTNPCLSFSSWIASQLPPLHWTNPCLPQHISSTHYTTWWIPAGLQQEQWTKTWTFKWSSVVTGGLPNLTLLSDWFVIRQFSHRRVFCWMSTGPEGGGAWSKLHPAATHCIENENERHKIREIGDH